MPRINERMVLFKERFPAKENWDLPQALSAVATQAQDGNIDLKAAVPVLQRVIGSWEFDGLPSDAEAYGELDIFRELIPLLTAAAQFIAELTGTGEAASGRTLP
jgi:hypothetical protein